MSSKTLYGRLFNKQAAAIATALISLCVFSLPHAHQQQGVEHDHWRLTPIISSLLNSENDETQPPSFSTGAFIENNGLVVVELESSDLPAGWTVKSDDADASRDYVEWTNPNSLQVPGRGLISIKVVINEPGNYQFIWRNSIREGSNATESNDSFLRILADNFYGFRTRNNSTVCPRDQAASNRCAGQAPRGSSRDGWFKIYRSGGPARAWLWKSFTSDNDAHLIFAEFDRAGEYEIQISGRSRFHAIDRLVLFRSGNSANNVSEAFATDSARPESSRVP